MTSTAAPPLTTTFSPPAACTTNTWLIENLSSTDYYTTTITTGNTGWWLNLGPTNWSSCFPTSYETNTEFYYSPGVCPSGYWAAGQGVSTIDANEEETHATCCPNNYIVQTESPTLDWQKTNLCSSRNTHSTVWYYTQGGTTTSLTTTADGINAKGISIRWRSADFVAQPTSASASDTPATASATATATGTSTNPSDDSTHSSGLSTGAKAGIAIGVAVGAIAIITVLALLWMRRRKERLNAQVDRPAPQSPQPRELDGSHFTHEMPAGSGLPADLEPEPEIKPHYVSELPTGRD